jgi:hypothetical protein
MKLFKAAPAVLCAVVLGAAFSSIAKADEHDKKTTVTFSQPVEIPGVHLKGWGVLPAGTYVFKLMNSSSNRHIVQIFNKDQTQIYATILAIPNYRLKPTSKTVITFNEGIRGRPVALRAWFYPGANWGEEFVYPKAKAVELASTAKLPVLAATKEFKLEVEKAEELQAVTELETAPVMAVRPTGEVVELAQVIQPVPQQVLLAQAAAPASAPARRLPATASPLPMIAMCGLIALGGALSIRSIAKRAL